MSSPKGETDLILLDNKLPDRNGIEILKEIKRGHPKVPVIIMTAFGTTETAIEAMRLGAFDYILKPFELDEISELVAKGIGSAQADEQGRGHSRPFRIPGGFGSDHRQEQSDAGSL